MKKRFSVEKAEWSDTRERQYEADARAIASTRGKELVVRDGSIFAVVDDTESLLCTPAKQKSFWFETWQELRYGNSTDN